METIFFLEETPAEVLYSSDCNDFSILPHYGQTLPLDEQKDLRIISKQQKKEAKIDRVQCYKGFEINQKISVKYRDLTSKICLKPCESVFLGLKEKLRAFNDKFTKYGLNFADEILTFRIVFIMRDGGTTKVFFQVE